MWHNLLHGRIQDAVQIVGLRASRFELRTSTPEPTRMKRPTKHSHGNWEPDANEVCSFPVTYRSAKRRGLAQLGFHVATNMHEGNAWISKNAGDERSLNNQAVWHGHGEALCVWRALREGGSDVTIFTVYSA